MEFRDQWGQYLPLCKFAYNNSYHPSIDLAPFKAFYGRMYKSSIGWFDIFEVRTWGTNMLKN